MLWISRKNKERLKNGSIPVFLSFFGFLAIIFRPELNSGIPSYSSLRHANGVVSSVYRSHGKSPYIEFKVQGISTPFYYDSIAGELGLVGDALEGAQLGVKPIEVLYEKRILPTFFKKRELYDVWQLNTEASSIRSFADISVANEANNRVGQIICQIIGCLLLLLSIATALAFLKKEFGRKQY